MVGRVPLIPLFPAGNTTPTIPHMFSKRKDVGFPFGCANATAVDGLRGRSMSAKLTRGCGSLSAASPAWGGLSVEKTVERKHDAKDVRNNRAAETKRVRKTAPA
jgi:hypothetical protein